MKDYSGIIQDIKDNITENGKGEITGRDLREILLEAIGNVSVDMGELDRRIEAILGGENYDDIINSWAELEQFLSGLDESSNLVELLSYKADKSDVYSRSDINTKLEDYTKTDDLGALALKDEVEMSDIKNLEDALDKKLDKEGGEIENNLLVKGELKMGVLFVPTSDGDPSSYRLAIGELGEGADIPSSGEGGLGSVTIMLGDIPYYSDSNGIVRLPAYPTGGGDMSGYLPLSGGTITGLVTFANNEISLNGVYLAYNSEALRVRTQSGYSWFGMMNNSACHIYTDAPLFYMNKPLKVDNGKAVIHEGNIGSQSVDYARYAGFTPKLLASDIRDTNPTPNDVTDFGVSAWFSNVWNPEPSSYWYSGITIKGWSDSYEVWQLASSSEGYNVNTGLFFRNGIDNSWNNWRRVITENENGNVLIGDTADNGNRLQVQGAITLTTALRMTFNNNSTCGLYPDSWISGADASRLWLYNTGKVAICGEQGIEIHSDLKANGHIIATKLSIDASYGVSPTAQGIVINTTNNANDYGWNPGIGFHIPGITYGTIKLTNDSLFRFFNSSLTGYFGIVTGDITAYGNIFANGYQLPTSPPDNPVSGGYYLYVGTLGSGAVIS